MENDQETKLIQKLYKEVIQEEIARPDFKLEKKAFIDEHFSREPFLLMRPAVLVPALSLCCVLFLFQLAPMKSFLNLPSQTPPVVDDAVDLSAEPGQRHVIDEEASVEGKAGDEPRENTDPDVDVKWARSEVGSVMVYQKDVGDVPITVVWVFTPTEAPGL